MAAPAAVQRLEIQCEHIPRVTVGPALGTLSEGVHAQVHEHEVCLLILFGERFAVGWGGVPDGEDELDQHMSQGSTIGVSHPFVIVIGQPFGKKIPELAVATKLYRFL